MRETSKGAILIVDHDPQNRQLLQTELTRAGYAVCESDNAAGALTVLSSRPTQVVMTDIRLPDASGVQLLRQIKSRWPHIHVIISTADGSIGSAVEAMKFGASEYLEHPLASQTLLDKVSRLCPPRPANAVGSPTSANSTGAELVGTSALIRQTVQQVHSASTSDHAVLLVGEIGAGKARLADRIHQLSPRANGPLIRFSCVAANPEILDRALLGHAENGISGSNGHGRTSASGVGQLHRAHEGTLYLEDVDQLPPQLQIKLLDVMNRISASPPGVDVLNVRFICGTTRNLQILVREGRFRTDLYQRIAPLVIHAPALRDRSEDILPLAIELLQRTAQLEGRTPRLISAQAVDVLKGYDWPGNVRQLEHVLRQAASSGSAPEILAQDLPLPHTAASSSMDLTAAITSTGGLTETIAGVERTLINDALRRAAGNQAKAAKFLNIPRTTLRDKMAKHGLVGDGVHRETPPAQPETPQP